MASEIAGSNRTVDDARLARLIEPGSLLEATPECLVIAHPDGRIVFANRHTETLTGFSREELVGRSVASLIVEDLLDGEPDRRIETLCHRRDGHTLPVEVHLGAIEGPEKLLVVTLRDATELQAGREATYEAEVKYRTLIEQISAVSYTWSVREAEYVVAYASPQIEEALGYTVQQWTADPAAWYDWVHPEDRALVIAENKRCEASGESHAMEYRMVRSDGRTIWVADRWVVADDERTGERVFQGIVFDVTERKQAEESLRGQTDRQRAIIEIQRAIASADLDVDAVMKLMCQRTQGLMGAGAVAILMAGEKGFVHVAATGFMAERIGQVVPLDGTLTGWVHEHDRSTVCVDAATDPRAGAPAVELGIRSVVIVPLRHGDGPVGQLQVLSEVPGAFTEEDVDTLELLSVVLSAAMSHAAEFEAKHDQVEALALFQAIYEGAPIGVTLLSPEGHNIRSNPAFLDMLGYTADELAAMSLRDYTHPDDIDQNTRLFRDLVAGTRETPRFEKRYLRKDGEVLWAQVSGALLRDADGQPKYVISMVENVTDRKLAEERVAFLAYHDKLTGLPNRTLFEEMLESAVARAKRHDTGVGVLLLDLDNFKLVNDTLGHAAGDQLLAELAERLRKCTRETDLVARQGGDEFSLLLPDLDRGGADDSDAAARIAEMVASRVHEALAQPFDLNGTEFHATGSMGISLYPNDARDKATLMQHADEAMYRSKRMRPGAHAQWSEINDPPILQATPIAERLRRAAAERSWVLHWQPIVDLASGAIFGAEGLIRWRDDQGGLVQPGEFLPMAEEMGLLESIGEWAFQELCRQDQEWRSKGLDLQLGMNLSSSQLWSARLSESLLAPLREAGIPPNRVCIEVSESTVMADPVRAQKVMAELKAWGLRLAIDDFGLGRSSLSRVASLPADILKIDRSVVRGVDGDPDLVGTVRAIVGLAEGLGMKTHAVGIETETEAEVMRQLGCTSAQGFLFGRPLPGDQIPGSVTARLNAGRR
jgi:diguanylate cyclase (GGDEF)-like protein/PAS domain S-box-containing protein